MKSVLALFLMVSPLLAFAAKKTKNFDYSKIKNTNYFDISKTSQCAPNLNRLVGTTLSQKSWMPKAIAEPFKSLKYGIAHRNTKTQMSYKIWVDGPKTFFSTGNEKTAKEQIVTFDSQKACKISKKDQALVRTPAQNTVGFNDDSLAKLTKENKVGLIYVWSPYMPLSLDALKEVKAAASIKHLPLTVLVDWKAEKSDVKAWMDKGLVNNNETLKVASSELFQREIGVHFPVLYFYKDQFLSNNDYLGHKSKKIYGRWIDYQNIEIEKDLK